MLSRNQLALLAGLFRSWTSLLVLVGTQPAAFSRLARNKICRSS